MAFGDPFRFRDDGLLTPDAEPKGIAKRDSQFDRDLGQVERTGKRTVLLVRIKAASG